MEVDTILGFLGALLIGMVLGLIGGGGSILTVPVLVYLLGVNPVIATAYSLFVVGTSSLVGAITNMKKGKVVYRTALFFSVPAFVVIYTTRKYLVPAIPAHLFSFAGFEITRSIGIMLFFALIMILASFSMIREQKATLQDEHLKKPNYPLLMLQGMIIGAITGIIGAGGGFLIIPTLVLLARLPMKKAIATSLLIIAVNSLVGFIGDIQNLDINWSFLATFTILSVGGIFIGISLNKFINGKKLKKSFGWFVLLMGIYIILKELL